MAKKAQGLPLNTIIIAALVLIVLVLLVLIFTGRINLFQKGIDTCQGSCSSVADCGNGVLGYYMGACKDSTGAQPVANRPYCCPSK